MSACSHERASVRMWLSGWVDFVDGEEVEEVETVEAGDYDVRCNDCGRNVSIRSGAQMRRAPQWVHRAISECKG